MLKGKLASKKDPEDFEYLNVYAVAAGRSVADVHLHTKLMETNKVPFNLENSRPDLKSPFFYAYHFDNHLVGNYLRKRSKNIEILDEVYTHACLLYTSPSPRDRTRSRMPSSA